MALRTIIALGNESVIDEVIPYLESDNLALITQAVVGLLQEGGESGFQIGKTHLEKLVNSEKEEERESFGIEIVVNE